MPEAQAQTADPLAGFAHQPGKAAPTAAAEPEADPLTGFAYPAQTGTSVGEAAGAVGQGVTHGLVEAAPRVAGAIAGGKLGFAGGLMTGPAAPIAAPLLAGAGAVGGYLAGAEFGDAATRLLSSVRLFNDEPLTFESMESVPLRLRPYAKAGETFGANLPFIAAPFALQGTKFVEGAQFFGGFSQRIGQAIRQMPEIAGSMLNRMIDGAARYPGTFATAEISANLSASAASGIAEGLYPGETGPQIAGQIVGGISNPARWIIAGTRGAVSRIGAVKGYFTGAAQQDRAAALVFDILKREGENPDAVIQAIRDNRAQFSNLNLTAGQMSGSAGLLDMEHSLAKESAKFGHYAAERVTESLDALKTMIVALETSADPVALKAAAQLRKDYITTLMETRLRLTEDAALRAAAEIAPNNPADLAQFGRRTADILDEAMGEVRKTESSLWGAVPRNIKAAPTTSVARFDELRAERLPDEKLPAIVEDYIRGIRGRPASAGDAMGIGAREAVPAITDTGDLLRFRSRMLAMARESAAKNDWSDARVYGAMAEAALDDLGAVSDISPALDAARTWSRQLNDTFSRTFAGDAMAVKPSGSERIPPELVMRRAFGPGRELGELQFRQLTEAADMAGREYVSRMASQQEETLRFMAQQTTYLDATGARRVNPDRLRAFMDKHQGILGPFPDLQDQLRTAEGAERLFQRMDSRAARVDKIMQQSMLAKVLGPDDPTVTVARALRGTNPVTDFDALAKLAASGGPQAREGFKSAIYSYTHKQALSATGEFSFARYFEALNRPLTTNGPSALVMAVRHKIMSANDAGTLAMFLKRASEIEATLVGRVPIKDLGGTEAFIFDFVNRIQGAAFARVLPTGGAHPLIVASAGSRLARQIFDKVPRQNTKQLVEEITKSPEMMALLLEREVSKADRVRMTLQVNAFLWQAGLTALGDFED